MVVGERVNHQIVRMLPLLNSLELDEHSVGAERLSWPYDVCEVDGLSANRCSLCIPDFLKKHPTPLNPEIQNVRIAHNLDLRIILALLRQHDKLSAEAVGPSLHKAVEHHTLQPLLALLFFKHVEIKGVVPDLLHPWDHHLGNGGLAWRL
jgi:hypothetical protein